MTQDRYYTFVNGLRAVLVVTMMLLASSHAMAGVVVHGNVYGGGNLADVGGSVVVNIEAGTIDKDVYGGGALANTNTNNWNPNGDGYEQVSGLIVGTSVVTGYYTKSSEGYTEITTEGTKAAEGTFYYKKTGTWAATHSSTTIVNLFGGTITGDAYGGGLGRKEYGTEGQAGYESAVEAMVYGDVKIILNGLDKSCYDAADDASKAIYDDVITKSETATIYPVKTTGVKGAVVNRVFGCNNLNGTPKGKVNVYVYATQSSTTNNLSSKARDKENPGNNPYDVQAVYGGGNLAKYEPVNATLIYNETNKATVDAARPEVLIEGCDVTSIKQVYGGGNAAPAPATYVEVRSAYEIDEVFGGGNGYDNYSLQEGGVEKWYQNPGANVGYYTYASYPKTGTDPGAGTYESPWKAVETTAYSGGAENKEARLAATGIQYGSGVATLVVKGGTIHTSYGGSNSKGNVRAKLASTYTAMAGCDMVVGTSYGGGKEAYSDADADVSAECAKGVKEMFGGSKDADFNGNIDLRITNGSSLERVFGGNNTSGAVNGSITVTIEEGGCEPIRIGELYLGGYLAPYSVYGYNADKSPKESGDGERLYADPRLNVISATYIGKIFGGGYQATLVGNPHINVNMQPGRVLANYVDAATFVGEHKDENNNVIYKGTAIDTNGDGILEIGTIGTIYGGGNEADVVGDTYVEIGTGQWLKDGTDNVWETKDANGVTYTYEKKSGETEWKWYQGDVVQETAPTPARMAATITGDVFGGGNEAHVTGNTHVIICAKKSGDNYISVTSGTDGVTIEGTHPEGEFGRGVFGGGNVGNVTGNSYVYLGGGSVNQSVYGGGCKADVKGNTFVTMSGGYVFDGVCGGGLSGSVGTIDTNATDHLIYHTGTEAHEGCIGKPNKYKANTGKCTTVISGGQVGPVELATVGMGTAEHPAPISEGWVWGAGRGVVEDPSTNPDTHFKTYVNETEVTIKDDAFIVGSIIGGGEFGRVLGNTLVKIEGGQIGVGAGQTVTESGVQKPERYNDGQFANPLTTEITETNALAACSHFIYGKQVDGKTVYEAYDPYYDKYYDKTNGTHNNNIPEDYSNASTANPSDGKTWIGCVFGGGSGYFPYEKVDGSGYDWVSSAGLVEGNAEVRISGGHILTNVYGGNEYTNVNGKCTVKMSGGTIGVPRTLDQIKANPMCGNLYGAGKGDPRSHFDTFTNVGSVEVEISGGIIYGSVYGGSEDGHVLGDAKVTVKKNADNSIPVIGTWGASYIDGNVYGGGKGNTTNIISGLIKGNTEIAISDGTILHNIYGGGAYGSVGEFDYDATTGLPTGRNANTTGGKSKIEITGGTIGTTGKENGMVFGSSRGDVGAPGEIHDKLAWVYDTEVKIGTSGASTGPAIKGSVYGSGENGHTYHDAEVIIQSGTIGITNTSIDGGAAYLYRGNVYGGGCGTDKYYSGTVPEGSSANDGNGDKYNPLAGIVYGDATVNIDGGNVVRNVYGAGAMGSVGKVVSTTTENVTTTTVSGGQTTINISGGTIGVEGTAGDGNVFGAARGNASATSNEYALVRKGTSVSVSGDANVKGNVYGGGELGCVGTYVFTDDMKNFYWTNEELEANKTTYTYNNTGVCNVNISGGTIGTGVSVSDDGTYANGNVFGAGKGLEDTWWCEKAIAYKTNVTITNGTINGTVYGGGQVGRVETDAAVTIGTENESIGESKPNITGNVFGAGAGVKTHGYSALVRGDASVTVQGVAQVGGSVYGGGEIASVGRFTVIGGLPKHPDSGGNCTVTIQDHAKIGASGTTHNVFGACKGVTPVYVASGDNRSKSMQLLTNAPSEASLWDHYNNDENSPFIWRYYATEADYLDFLETLALTSHPIVTIAEDATVNGSVYGGGERGITLGSVEVNMNGGTVTKDVYGGGSLANSNKGNWDTDKYVEATDLTVGESVVTGLYTRTGTNTGNDPYVYTVITDADTKAASGTTYYIRGAWTDDTKKSSWYTTHVSLTGGTINGDAYGGGLGQKEYGTKGQTGYEPAIEAQVYGDVLVELNGKTVTDNGTTTTTKVADNAKGCIVNRVFGCNNLNGTPKGKVNVHVYGTQKSGGSSLSDKTQGSYDVLAVYGGGNLAKYEPVDAKSTDEATLNAARPEVLIEGCGVTSIKQVYGGGNAAPAPATYVEVRSAYEIDEVFGGGNGYDNYSLLEGGVEKWYQNPGANVGYYTYASYPKTGTDPGAGTSESPWKAVETTEYSGGAEHKEARLAATDIQYGSGIATLVVKGGTIHTSYGGSNSKGNVRKQLSSTYTAMIDDCAMAVGTSYGGGKNAYSDADAEVSADCAKGVKEMFGGSRDADFDGNINLTISNGSSLERVFGGNNTSGAVNGSITVTIKEGGCEPIRIGSLYAGGFLAPYSVYGYEKNTDGSYKTESVEYIDENNVVQTKLQRIPLQSGTRLYNDPRINVISATRIDNIFGGGYQAKLVGNPHINVNMEKGKISEDYRSTYSGTPLIDESGNLPIGTIGNIYGGGNLADIVGDTYVEIGTGTWVTSWDNDGKAVYETIAPARNAATITGNVFGGGKGKADTFKCEKAMIGVENQDFGSTNVIIGNGTVGSLDENGKLVEGTGNVYGGGQIGRVELNTNVTIGLESGTSEPIIRGNVFGAGKGENIHGYAALVRGNSTVTVQNNAKVGLSVYGGGEIASVGKYNLVNGFPVSLVSDQRGICSVTVKDNAEVGPDNMKMYHEGVDAADDKPDDAGHVFGGGKGILPYVDMDSRGPGRIGPDGTWEDYTNDETKYFDFIKTLALVTQTTVNIEGNTFIKGSVYGGSENGLIQHDTRVYIKGGQIGNGDGINRRYTAEEWAYDGSSDAKSLKECAHWVYEAPYASYDPFANATAPLDNYSSGASTEGGRKIASDGHTYYGNVFGGGSGSIPYLKDGISKYNSSAGTVEGDTYVEISGGHILTNVYGGCESTNVMGTANVTMTGGSIGVPRTPQQIKDHPVTCYLFGAGKGDQRIFFNKETNVNDAIVKVEGGTIYGSVFGGGEDGHVLRNTKVTIGKADGTGPIIGTVGSTYVDGNVFGGGRGFGGEALTAGNIGGSVDLTINGGEMLGSIYGGGRLASVGYGLYLTTEDGYGKMREDNEYDDPSKPISTTETAEQFFIKGRGHIKVTVNGGTIGRTFESDVEGEHSGNVFGGSMGRLTKLDGTPFDAANHWALLATAKSTEVNIKGGTIMRSVYGGGEMGTVTTNAKVNVSNGTIGTSGKGGAEFGNVYGGGKGYVDPAGSNYVTAGIIKGNTTVAVSGTPNILHNVYGGGAYGSVGTFDLSTAENLSTYHVPYAGMPVNWTSGTGIANVTITGGTIGTDGNENGMVFGSSRGDVGVPGEIHDKLAWVYDAKVVIGSSGSNDGPQINGSVYGSGENGHTFNDATVNIHAGTIGIVSGSTITTNDNGTPDDTSDDTTYSGAEYPYRGNVYGGGCGTDKYDSDSDGNGDTYNPLAGIVQGNAFVNMTGGFVVHNVYGAGAMGSVGTDTSGGKTTVSISGGRIGYDGSSNGNVYGAARGDLTATGNLAQVRETAVNISYTTTPAADNEEKTAQLIAGSVFGGGEAGTVKESVAVNMTGGLILNDVYGGGALADTQTSNWDASKNEGVGGWAEGKTSASNTTTVNLHGGTIGGDAYGGGLGQKTGFYDANGAIATSDIEATVFGDITVNLGSIVTPATEETPAELGPATAFNISYEDTGDKDKDNQPIRVVKSGRVFGCNNLNGSPQGNVTVNVYKTVADNVSRTASEYYKKKEGEVGYVAPTYELAAVYGGGNLANYSATGKKASVTIHTCHVSVQHVYGGGNAAAVPETDVLVKGAYEIEHVFGGGNGKDKYKKGNEWILNAGADVSTNTNTLLIGGYIHEAYGGSNEKGTIGGNVTINTNSEHEDCACDLELVKLYGAGKNADIDGDLIVVLDCAPETKTEEIYGGAENANVRGNVELTITSGTFGKVFGGNNQSGAIFGHIILNIEETSCRPIIIDELYGCGNNAAYSVYGYKNGTDAEGNQTYVPRTSSSDGEAVTFKKDANQTAHTTPQYADPQVNIISCTRIGQVFGGGYGAGATVWGNPTVNINQIYGKAYSDANKTHYDAVATSLGEIGEVFGGGNKANVVGNTTVNIGTASTVQLHQSYDKKNGYSMSDDKPVLGANITGNVYGGGNKANVSGNTNVNIGKATTTTNTTTTP